MVVRPWGFKACLCSTQLIIEFIMLINVKMPTIIGILACISLINTSSTFEFLLAVEMSCPVELSIKSV